jgi:hypothetical protein
MHVCHFCNYLPSSPEQHNLTITPTDLQNVKHWQLPLHGTRLPLHGT